MANNNFYPGQNPGQSIGSGEGEVPLAKPTAPNMDVRTMGSDMQSINTENPAPKPYAPPVSAPDNIPVAPPTPVNPSPDQSFQIPSMDAATPSPEMTPKKSSKGIFTAIIVFIVVVGLAALGYFVIYPIFFANPATPPVATNPTPEPAPTPAPVPTPEPIPAPTPAPTPAPHISLFTTPADGQIEATAVTTGAALSGLTITATSPSLSELIYKDQTGNLTKFADVLKTITGLDISSNNGLKTAFNDQTAMGLVYADVDGRWLGVTAKLADTADVATVSAAFKEVFEAIPSYAGLFSSDPGTSQTWKDGQVTGVTGNRYLLFSKSGFAVDYGWVGSKLVVMTSYNGFKEVAKRVQ